MATVPTGVIVGWPSTIASIPSGWTRETALDGRYIQGAAGTDDADLTTDDGNSVHSHTVSAGTHTPTVGSHSHDAQTTSTTGTTTAQTGGTTASCSTVPHTHNAATSTSSTPTYSSESVGTIQNNISNAFSIGYTEVIWIYANGSPAVSGLPDGCYAFFKDDASFPASWTRVAGDSYLKGALGTLSPGGSSPANGHYHTDDGHTHTEVGTHTHTATSPTGAQAGARRTGAVTTAALATHTHSLTLDATSEDPLVAGVAVTDTTTPEPEYKKLNCLENGTGGNSLPDKIICLWGGAHADIGAGPLVDWARYTSMNGYFLKCANADGEVASTDATPGGTTTHGHTATCTLTFAGHTHTVTAGAASTTQGLTSSTGAVSPSTHTHTWETGTQTGGLGIATSTEAIDDSAAGAHYPPFHKVIFIEYTAPASTYNTAQFFNVL